MIQIILQSVNKSFLDELNHIAGEVAGRIPLPSKVIVPVTVVPLPLTLYDFQRGQYRAEAVNGYLYGQYKGLIEGVSSLYVIGVVEGSGYAAGTNYVFGLASPEHRVASVYTAQIRPGDASRRGLLEGRLRKLILHELGHLLGLGHCDKNCVMRFSRDLRGLDEKPDRYCDECRRRLMGGFQGRGP